LTPTLSITDAPSLIEPFRAQVPSAYRVHALQGIESISPGQLSTAKASAQAHGAAHTSDGGEERGFRHAPVPLFRALSNEMTACEARV
jgi:hypothetical protein